MRHGQSVTEALIDYLSSSSIFYRVCVGSDFRLQALFIAYLESIQYLQAHHDVLLIDNTYSTNRFGMPLIDIIS
jgi:hypothetical protein